MLFDNSFMYKNVSLRGFTLAELMVWIAILSILWFWIAQLNFERLSQSQQLDIEIVKITNILEETRNNSLIWKWVWVNLDTPDNWSVIIDSSVNGSIESRWTIASVPESFDTWNAGNNFSITNLRCQAFDGTNDLSTSSSVSINYIWPDLDLVGCSSNDFKRLVFDYGIWNTSKEISINAVTWVIEKN